MSFEKPRFDQPKTSEIIKTPAEAANELRARITALNEKLQGKRGSTERLQTRCDKEGNQEACKLAKRAREIEIPQILKELDTTAAELEKVSVH